MRTLLLVTLLSQAVLAAPPTLAIGYFDNNSSDPSLDPLSRGLADMLITDLSNVQALQLVEREKLNLALDELKLSKSKFIDPKTALKLGKGLSARYLLVGGYTVLQDTMRLDARFFDVQKGSVLFSEAVSGKKDEFFALEKELVDLILKALELKVSIAEKSKLRSNPTERFDAFTAYAEGLVAKDAGDEAKARERFEAALAKDPNYRAAKTATERLTVIFQREDAARSKQFSELRKTLDPKAKDFPQKVATLLTQLQEGKVEEQALKLEVLTWLAENDLTPPGPYGLPTVAVAGLGIAYRHTEDPTQWENIPRACEYFIARYPAEEYPKTYCRSLLQSLKYEKTRDRAEAQREWDEERESDLKKLDPDDWRISLHKNEAAMRKLIALYASKVKP
jgi:TolB-like protein